MSDIKPDDESSQTVSIEDKSSRAMVQLLHERIDIVPKAQETKNHTYRQSRLEPKDQAFHQFLFNFDFYVPRLPLILGYLCLHQVPKFTG